MDSAPMNTQVGRVAPANQPSGGVGSPYIEASGNDIKHYAAKIEEGKTPPHLRSARRALNPDAGQAAEAAPQVSIRVIQERAERPEAPAQVAAAVAHNPNITGLELLVMLKDGLGPIGELAEQALNEQRMINA